MDLNKVADQLMANVEGKFSNAFQQLVNQLLDSLNIKQYGVMALIAYILVLGLLIYVAWKVRHLR
jgi:hypothetical protein